MICPHCSASLKYKERSNSKCSVCDKYFAFDPKDHPLLLNDVFFQAQINKISEYGKIHYTRQQLHFAVSRKKINKSLNFWWVIFPAIMTSFMAFVVVTAATKSTEFAVFAVCGVLAFWLILIIILKINRTFQSSLPPTLDDFEGSIQSWKGVYQQFPINLITEIPENKIYLKSLRGILLCETQDIANFLVANHLEGNLSLAILANTNHGVFQQRPDLPIFVLHDAGTDGYNFWQKINTRFGNQRKVFDIGLRPKSVMQSKLIKFRQKSENNGFNGLSPEENKWLKKGNYTPLFVIRPAKLIKYVTEQINKRIKLQIADNPEKQAKAVGFMTWTGEN